MSASPSVVDRALSYASSYRALAGQFGAKEFLLRDGTIVILCPTRLHALTAQHEPCAFLASNTSTAQASPPSSPSRRAAAQAAAAAARASSPTFGAISQSQSHAMLSNDSLALSPKSRSRNGLGSGGPAVITITPVSRVSPQSTSSPSSPPASPSRARAQALAATSSPKSPVRDPVPLNVTRSGNDHLALAFVRSLKVDMTHDAEFVSVVLTVRTDDEQRTSSRLPTLGTASEATLTLAFDRPQDAHEFCQTVSGCVEQFSKLRGDDDHLGGSESAPGYDDWAACFRSSGSFVPRKTRTAHMSIKAQSLAGDAKIGVTRADAWAHPRNCMLLRDALIGDVSEMLTIVLDEETSPLCGASYEPLLNALAQGTNDAEGRKVRFEAKNALSLDDGVFLAIVQAIEKRGMALSTVDIEDCSALTESSIRVVLDHASQTRALAAFDVRGAGLGTVSRDANEDLATLDRLVRQTALSSRR